MSESEAVSTEEVESLSEEAKAPPTPAERQAACDAEIRAALERHGCNLVPQPITEPMGRFGEGLAIRVRMNVVPLEQP